MFQILKPVQSGEPNRVLTLSLSTTLSVSLSQRERGAFTDPRPGSPEGAVLALRRQRGGLAGQVRVDGLRRLASIREGPDDEARPAARVTRAEHAVHRRGEV